MIIIRRSSLRPLSLLRLNSLNLPPPYKLQLLQVSFHHHITLVPDQIACLRSVRDAGLLELKTRHLG